MRLTRTRAFTLLEVVVAVSIMVLIAGVAIPVTAAMVRSARSDATAKRLDVIASGVEAYFSDTLRFPNNLAALGSDDGVTGWAGPYVTDNFVAGPAGSSFAEDDFGTTIQLTGATASSIDLVSAGSDRAVGSADDVIRRVNVLPILREVTEDRLEVFNHALSKYNANLQQNGAGLSANVASAFQTLVSAGNLPDDSKYRFDAWGDAFVADPPGKSPLVKVASPNMAQSSASGSGGSGSGSGKGKGKGKGKGSGNGQTKGKK